MSIPHTEFGRSVLTELLQLNFLSFTIFGDNSTLNARLMEDYERRKADALDQLRSVIDQLGSGQSHKEVRITVENGADENAAYTEVLERVIGESLVARSIDLYHWYLRQVLEHALNFDRSLIRSWAPALGLKKEQEIAKIENSPVASGVVSKLFRGREGIIRGLVHGHLGVVELSAIPVLVAVRNCIAHHRGRDVEGKVEPLLADCPELGIEVLEKRVIISPSAAYESLNRVTSDISIIDQILANVLDVPKTSEPIPGLKRSYGCR